MSINYVTKYGKTLDQKLVQESLTADLETQRLEFLGAKTIKVPRITTSGYQPHTRKKGFNAGTLDNDFDTYTLGADWDIEFFADSMDIDETNEALSIANVSKTFIETQATPALDAYRFSKLYAEAQAGNKVNLTADKTNIYGAIKDGLKVVRKYGPQNIIVYVSSTAMDFLERSTEFAGRQFSVQAAGPSKIESRVTSIDGVILKEVWDETRFRTLYDFTNGYASAVGSKAINFMIVSKTSVIVTAKHSFIAMFAPGSHTEGDGHLYQNRLYHDSFVRKQQLDGVYVNTNPTLQV